MRQQEGGPLSPRGLKEAGVGWGGGSAQHSRQREPPAQRPYGRHRRGWTEIRKATEAEEMRLELLELRQQNNRSVFIHFVSSFPIPHLDLLP